MKRDEIKAGALLSYLNLLIGSINRKGKTWIPRGQDTIQVGDTVIIVTTQKGLGDILDILRK